LSIYLSRICFESFFQANIDFIAALKAAGEFETLTKAREKFSELYPLTAGESLKFCSFKKLFDTIELQ